MVQIIYHILFLVITLHSLNTQAMSRGVFKDKNQERFLEKLKTYEIVNPVVGTKGENISTDKNTSQVINVKFRAFGEDFHLHLQINTDFVAQGFSSELVNDGYLFRRSKQRHCFYGGTSLMHKGSIAAISHCNGVHGIVRTKNDEYFIEPMTRRGGQYFPHLVYRASDMRVHEPARQDASGGCVAVKGSKQSWSREKKTRPRPRVRRTAITDPTAQLLVVVDKDMVDFHGKDNVEEYILTVMNMVSQMYRDPSIGATIKIEVLKLILLQDTPKGLVISSNGRRTLRSFCDWQNSLQWMPGYEAKDHWHYDAAVLLTRKDICADKNEPCSTVGVGYMYGMCDPKRRCSISEDNGLNVAFTVAHELGHNLGIFHDGDGNSCSDYSGHSPHIMSSGWLSENVQSMKWSKCSRESLESFLRSKDSSCLDHHASSKTLVLPPDLAGIKYDADEQCRLQYGNRARHCHKFKRRLCQVLWCEIKGEPLCRTKRRPPVKGTSCGVDKWCMYGSCVNNTMIPVRRDGAWGEWSRWTTCSRTCGSGVSIMERKCNNPSPLNGGRYCKGERRRHRVCNAKPCPLGSKDFRVVQCASFNNTKYKGELYDWVPVLSDDQPCALFCKPVNSVKRFSAQLADKVIDGTPCAAGTRDICIDGKCQPVGCDHEIGSKAKEDICGMCNGNGTTCYTIEGSFDQLAGKGYVEVALIPKGARNVRVTEVKPCTSYLALRSDVGRYYINGNWKIQLPGDFDAEGTLFKYIRRGTWERLAARGPTTKPLHIMILYNGFNLGVRYNYTLPHQKVDSKESKKKTLLKVSGPTYGWIHGGWANCSAHCGGGIKKTLRMICVGFYDGKIRFVQDVYCADATKPREEERVCNEHACAVWWFVSSWQPCSSTCGIGVQKRQVKCKKQQRDGTALYVPSALCTEDKPSSLRNCINKACHLKWSVSPWSKCYSMCGVGVRRRLVKCPRKGKCSPLTIPLSTKHCYSRPCDEWAKGAWTKCSVKCGNGNQRRLVKCRNALTGKPSDKCPGRTRPADVKPCKMKSCKIFHRYRRCLRDKYEGDKCQTVLKFNLCHSEAWYALCCKTCE